MDNITRENEPHIGNDIGNLRDDELDTIAGGADTQAEQKTSSALSSALSQVIRTLGDGLQSAARG
jgi:hypothetical protein